MRIIQVVLLSILLSACASIPLKTVYNLWNFDPWTSDQREWRAAVRLPARTDADLAKARVTMKVETWVEGDSAKSAETFVLVRSTAPQDLNPLAAEARNGFALAAYMFAPEDHARLMALKNRIVAAKGTAKPVRGAIHISAKSCDPAMTKPAGPYPISTYLMVNRADGYNPMIVDYDLGPEMHKTNATPQADAACRL
jgi:hypothetical protein